MAALRRGREAYQSDERILGSSDFVEHLRQTLEARPAARRPRRVGAAPRDMLNMVE